MSQQEFESYLRLLARFLHLNGSQREAIARELRAHMEDRLEDLLARGYRREDAIATALDEFGDAAALADEFGRIGRRRRWIMRTTTATIGIAATVLLVSFLLPEHRPWVPAPAPTHAGQADDTAGPASVVAAAAPATAQENAPEMECEADRRTRERLQQVLATVDLAEGTSFADAMDFLRTQTKINISVNWAALGLIGVERTTDTGGVVLHDAKVETALEILLDNATLAGGGAGRVAYDVVDGVMRISTADDLSTRVMVRIYDCRDLLGQGLTPAQQSALDVFAARLAQAPRSTTRPAGVAETQPAHARSGGQAQPTRRRTADTDPLVAELLGELRNRSADQLVEVISSMIDPGSWMPEGTLGDVKEYDGFLVVRHTPSAHRQLAELLGAIRKAKALRAKTEIQQASR